MAQCSSRDKAPCRPARCSASWKCACAAAAVLRGAAHWPQNLFSGGFTAPQDGLAGVSAAAHYRLQARHGDKATAAAGDREQLLVGRRGLRRPGHPIARDEQGTAIADRNELV